MEVVGGSDGDPVLTVTSKIKLHHYFLKVRQLKNHLEFPNNLNRKTSMLYDRMFLT